MLLDLCHFLLFGGNLGVFFVHVLAVVLLGQGFLRFRVILNLSFLRFALQDVEFAFGVRQLGALITELGLPAGFVVLCRRRRGLVAGCGGLAGAGIVFGISGRCCRGGGGGRSGGGTRRRSRGHVVVGKNFLWLWR